MWRNAVGMASQKTGGGQAGHKQKAQLRVYPLWSEAAIQTNDIKVVVPWNGTLVAPPMLGRCDEVMEMT